MHCCDCLSSLVNEEDELPILEGEGVLIIFDTVTLQCTDFLRDNLQIITWNIINVHAHSW